LHSHFSLLPADKLPSTAPYGSMSAVLANIQLALKQGDEGLWYGVIRKLLANSVEELKGEYSGIDKAICKGTWEYSQYADMGRYLLRIGVRKLKTKRSKDLKKQNILNVRDLLNLLP